MKCKDASSGPWDLSWLEKVSPDRSWAPKRISNPFLDLPDAVLFVDVETDGLNAWEGHRPFLVGLSTTLGTAGVLDLSQGPSDLDGHVAELLRDDEVLKVGHNLKFDFKQLRAAGFDVRGPLVDTMLLTQQGNSSLNSYALKSLARIMGADTSSEKRVKDWLRRERLRRSRMHRRFEVPLVEPTYKDVPRAWVMEYLADDLAFTRKLAFSAGTRVAKLSPAVARMENSLVRVTAEMEERGLWADGAYFQAMAEKAAAGMRELEAEVHAIAKRPFKLSSGPQLADVMFKGLGLKCLKYTEKGAPCFDADTLPLYDHPLARGVLACRKLGKLKSTYYEPLAAMALKTGGTIHSNFNLLGARRTGRMSSSDPNLQNIPRRDKTVRRGFVCRPGFVTYYLDYSQVEMRVAAHYAGEGPLRRAILAGTDLHAQTAAFLFGKIADGNELLRFVGKTINFGILYGLGKRSLRKQLRKKLLDEIAGDAGGTIGPEVRALAEITETGAQALLTKYRRAYPDIAEFMAATVRQLHREGRIVDAYGRVYQVPAKEDYKSTNYLVQGTAAGIMKRAMLRLDRALRRDPVFRHGGERCHLVNTIHDELQVEVPLRVHTQGSKAHGPEWLAGREMVRVMEDRETFALPMTVDLSWSDKSWADKEGVELAA